MTPVEQRYHERNRLRREQRERDEDVEEERTAIRGGYPDAGDIEDRSENCVDGWTTIG